jgi:hypothetical protein
VTRFLKKLFPFLVLQAAIFALLVGLARRTPDPFIGSLISKHQRLSASARPRLVLIGGSNVAFGFQCELLEDQLPYAPTNMGIHASLGLEFMLADAVTEIEANDIVLLSLEYGSMRKRIPSRELWEGLLLRPGAFKRLDTVQLVDAGLGFFGHVCDRDYKILLGRDRNGSAEIYRLESFNKFGDVAAHRSLAPVRPYIDHDPRETTTLGCASEDLLPSLQAFVSACESRGAQVVIFFPPLSEQLFPTLRSELTSYVARQKVLFGVLGRLEDIPVPEQEFYDTSYHLTGTGSAHRTHQVIERLKCSGRIASSALANVH